MEKEIKVESLKISIGKKEIELNIEDAKKLKKALEDIFGKDVVHEHHDHWYYRYVQPYTPYWGTVCCTNGEALTANATNATNLTNASTPTTLCMNISQL